MSGSILDRNDERHSPLWRKRIGDIGFWGAVSIIILVGIGVRVWFLDYPMRYDESYFFLRYSAKSPFFIVTHFSHVFHTLCVQFVARWIGSSPATIRLPAFAAGAAVIPLTGWLAWLMTHRRSVVALAMIAVGGSSMLVEYSTNARGYSMLAMFATLAMILTVHLSEHPRRRWPWVVWGLIGSFGAFAHLTMVFPMVATGAALVAHAVVAGSQSRDRGLLIRGLLVGTAVWVACSLLLFAPTLLTQGVGYYGECITMCKAYLSKDLNENGGMFVALWYAFWRHATTTWTVVVLVGLGVYAITAIGRFSRRHILPGTMLVVLPLCIWLFDVPMVPRGWMFLFPLIFVCAAAGVVSLARLFPPGSRSVCTALLLGGATFGGAATLSRVARATYLCTWDHELVDAEPILAECERFGMDRCALIMRYSPATDYYARERHLSRPLRRVQPETSRVFVVEDTLRSLSDLWNESTHGYEEFGPPRLHRTLSRSRLYAIDRVTDHVARK